MSRKLRRVAAALVAASAVALGGALPSRAALVDQGEYHPVAPTRVLDTRIGLGGLSGKIAGGGAPTTFALAGRGGIPSSGVSAAVINVTVTEGTIASHLTVFPGDEAPPTSSSLNFKPNEDRPNLVTVKLSSTGEVKIRNNVGAVHVLFDVAGWYGTGTDAVPGFRYHPVEPVRFVDTREPREGPIDGERGLDLEIAGVGPVGIDATAVVANVTVTEPQNRGHVIAWPGDTAEPVVSNLNFVPGQTVPNLVTVPIAPDGFISIVTNTGPVHVIVDVVGWYDDGTVVDAAVFTPLAPSRILDTRFGTGSIQPAGKVSPRVATTVDVAGRGGVPTNASAVVMNVTVTAGTAPSHLVIHPAGTSPPTVSSLNFGPNQDIANLVIMKIGTNGDVMLWNNNGAVHVVFDVVGWF